MGQWKIRTVTLLQQHTGEEEADELAQQEPGPAFTNDLIEEFTDEVECYRSYLVALAKRLRAAVPPQPREVKREAMAPPFPPALKRLGQNFLIDPNIIRKIVDRWRRFVPMTWCWRSGRVEGLSRQASCAEAGRVIAVEIDPQLQPHLQENLGHCRNLDLRIGDALEFPFDSLPPRTVVVANLPYYASTPLSVRSAGCPRPSRSHGPDAADGGGSSV